MSKESVSTKEGVVVLLHSGTDRVPIDTRFTVRIPKALREKIENNVEDTTIKQSGKDKELDNLRPFLTLGNTLDTLKQINRLKQKAEENMK